MTKNMRRTYLLLAACLLALLLAAGCATDPTAVGTREDSTPAAEATSAPTEPAPTSKTDATKNTAPLETGPVYSDPQAESCLRFADELSASSTSMANTFALLDSNPSDAIRDLGEIRKSFAAKTKSWTPQVKEAARKVDKAMKTLITTTKKATSGSKTDAPAIQKAAANFQKTALNAARTCQEH